MNRILAIIAAGAFAPAVATADWITEFGAGYKFNSSAILNPLCTVVRIPEDSPLALSRESAHFQRQDASCGGDNPIFIGWPIAWERDFGGPWTIRAGWFHMSSWGDGKGNVAKWLNPDNDGREVFFDCACVVARFNWTRRR